MNVFELVHFNILMKVRTLRTGGFHDLVCIVRQPKDFNVWCVGEYNFCVGSSVLRKLYNM